MNLEVFITFDLDFTIYLKNNKIFDEFKIIKKILGKYIIENNIKATWFIRLDNKISKDFGSPDFFFKQDKAIISKLLSNGSVLGWHPHPYKFENGTFMQNTDEAEVISELISLLPHAKKHGLKIIRMGWGYQTNTIMKLLNDEGFLVDSSAIPRPIYPWESAKRDWVITKPQIYHPSNYDYRISSNNSSEKLNILEVPISVMKIKAPYDSKDVLRYCNLSYYSNFMKEPMDDWIKENNFLVTITHPYELYPIKNLKNSLISFSLSEFSNNISNIRLSAKRYNKKIAYKNLIDLANDRL